MMKTLTRLAPLFALLLTFGIQDAQAQLRVGLRGGFDLDVEDAFVGVDARYNSNMLPDPIVLNAAFDYFLLDSQVDDNLGVDVDQQLYVLDANALYRFGVDNQTFTPYAGAGLGVYHSSVDSGDEGESHTDFGLNLLAGARFGSGTLQPFAQARIRTLADSDLFSLTGGILYRIGGQ